MRKNVVALLLSMVLAAGSIGTLPVMAAETGAQSTAANEIAAEEKAGEVPATEGEEDKEDASEGKTARETAENSEQAEKAAEEDEAEKENSEEDETEDKAQKENSAEGEAEKENSAEGEKDKGEAAEEDEEAATEGETSTVSEDGNLEEISGENAEADPETEAQKQTDAKGAEQKEETASACGENAFWKIEDGKLIITGSGPMEDYDEIETPWFSQAESITSIVISSGITRIGFYAFHGCSEVTEVTIPDTVSELGVLCFVDCSSITSVELPDAVKALPYGAFEECSSLSKIKMPGVTMIDAFALRGTAIKELVLGKNMESLSPLAMLETDMTSYGVEEGNTVYSARDGVLYSADGKVLVAYPEGRSSTSFSVPSGVEGLGAAAFINCTSLEEVNLEEGLAVIGESCFEGCSSLKEITLPSSVEVVGPNAFPEDTVVNRKNPNLELSEDGVYYIKENVTVSAARNYDMAYSVLDLVNKERKKQGLGELYMDSSLLETAMVRAAETIVLFSHTRPDGSACFSANSRMSAENIAARQRSAEEVMNSWMNSPGHRANILSSSATCIGIGCVRAENGDYYWVQCFGMEDISANCEKPANKSVSQKVAIATGEFTEVASSEGTKYTYSLKVSGSTRMRPGTSQQLYVYLNSNSSIPTCKIDESKVHYSSSDEEVATVSSTGKVTAKKEGTVTITVSTSAGRYSDQITINTSIKASWTKDRNGWRYRWDDGVYSENTFEVIAGKTYYFDDDGYMVTGWQKIGGKWYYFGADGDMRTGWQRINGIWYYLSGEGVRQTGWQKIGGVWYYFNGSGAMKTGWQKVGGVWYYFNASGAMRTGWQKISGVWYYFNSDGAMQTGWQKIGGVWYYFNGSGAMQTGWQKLGGVWYYFNAAGAMRTGWQKVSGTWYYFAESGAMQTGWQKIGGIWYFFNGSGAMKTGWQKIGSSWYYFAGSGAMAANKWVGNYYLTGSGAMATNTWIGNYYVGSDGKWIPGYKAAK